MTVELLLKLAIALEGVYVFLQLVILYMLFYGNRN